MLFGGVTEISDLIDALYDALPNWVKPKRKNGQLIKLKMLDKLQLIWEHADLVDTASALDNIFRNGWQDDLGAMHGIGRGAGGNPSGTGYQTGPWDSGGPAVPGVGPYNPQQGWL